MTTWYGGDGWGWCGMTAHTFAMTLLWGAVFTAIVLAIGFALRQRSDSPASTGTGSRWTGSAVAAHITGNETDNDEFWRRLM